MGPLAAGLQRAVAIPVLRQPSAACLGQNAPYFRHQLARIYILIGEQDKALDLLEPLLKQPYYLSPGWLKIDPTFDPLRSNPRFKRLVESSA